MKTKKQKTKVQGKFCRICRNFFKPKDNCHASKYCSQACYWFSMRGRTGKETSGWKGEDAKITSIHKWMSNNLDKPNECLFCNGNESRLEWANISGDYLREGGDYICLCQKCRSQWDRLAIKKWRTQKKKNVRLCGIDFDGTLCEGTSIPRRADFNFEKPTKDAIDAIKWMISMDFEPYVLTAREVWEWGDIVMWLHGSGFPGMMVTNRKKKGTIIYLDDRAVRFAGWKSFCKLLG